MLSISFSCCIKLLNIKNNPERTLKFKPFIVYYNWKEISFPCHQKDWKMSE